MNDMRQEFEQHPIHEAVARLEKQFAQINEFGIPQEYKQHIKEIGYFIELVKNALNMLTGPLYPLSDLSNIQNLVSGISSYLQTSINDRDLSHIKGCYTELKRGDYPLLYLLQSKQNIATSFENVHENLSNIDETIKAKMAIVEQMLQKQQEQIEEQYTKIRQQQLEIRNFKAKAENTLNQFVEQNIQNMESAKEKAQDAEEKAQDHAEKIAELLGIANGQVTGEKYTIFAEKLDKQAFWQQFAGIGFGLGAVLLTVGLTVSRHFGIGQQFHWGNLLGQISATSILLFIAIYLLTAASNKKKEAKKYRQASLLSLSLEGFVAQMPDEIKQSFRMMIGERLYRPDDTDIKADDTLSYIERISQRKNDEEDDDEEDDYEQ